jgi:uncharacterized protein
MSRRLTICAVSDIHGAIDKIDSIGDVLREADIVSLAGDLTRNGSRAETEEVLKTLEKYNSTIVAVHGNWDREEVQDILEDRKYTVHNRGKIIKGIGFFGVGGSTRTPMRTPGEYSEEELYEFVSAGYELISQTEVKALISHSPPRGTMDRTYLRLKGGSASIKDFIMNNEVSFCHCGHIHEACGNTLLRDTMVVNSGSLRGNCYYTIEIDGVDVTYVKKKI